MAVVDDAGDVALHDRAAQLLAVDLLADRRLDQVGPARKIEPVPSTMCASSLMIGR